jgi:hypothetical protein
MGQTSRDAAVKDAQTILRKVECAEGMGQSTKDAAAKDVRI